jgi:hypothetical protein
VSASHYERLKVWVDMQMHIASLRMLPFHKWLSSYCSTYLLIVYFTTYIDGIDTLAGVVNTCVCRGWVSLLDVSITVLYRLILFCILRQRGIFVQVSGWGWCRWPASYGHCGGPFPTSLSWSGALCSLCCEGVVSNPHAFLLWIDVGIVWLSPVEANGAAILKSFVYVLSNLQPWRRLFIGWLVYLWWPGHDIYVNYEYLTFLLISFGLQEFEPLISRPYSIVYFHSAASLQLWVPYATSRRLD